MSDLEGKVAFITGVARGQGKSHALALAAAGVDIIGIDICQTIATAPSAGPTSDDLAETARLIEKTGRRAITAEIDVRDLAAMTAFGDQAVGQLGRLDIVLANAGIAGGVWTLDMTEEQWDTMIDINLTGVWKTIKASVPHIVSGGRGGSVVITSSLASVTANEHTAHYSAAKAGLVSLMRVLAKELGPQGIRVNTIHPTSVATEMVLNDTTYRLFRPELESPTRADYEEALARETRLPMSILEVEDVTNIVMHLVSDTGRYITGSQQLLDAGGSL